LVSAVSALIAFTILTLVYGVLRLWTEVPSALFSNVLATFPNYYLNRRWVWGKSGRSRLWQEIVPFWVLSITGILLSLVTASLAHHFSDTHHLSHVLRTVVVVGANTAAFGLVWVLKFIVLNRLFRSLSVPERGGGAPPHPAAGASTESLLASTPNNGAVTDGSNALNARLVEGISE
jgi:putative flippase GtrA